MGYTCNSSTQEAKAGEYRVQGQPRLQATLSQNIREKTTKNRSGLTAFPWLATPYVDQVVLELTEMLLPLRPEYWD